MVDPTCIYCSKVCKTTRGLTKHISSCKVRQGKARRTVPRNTMVSCNTMLPRDTMVSRDTMVPRNTLLKTIHFPATPEAEPILEPIEESDYKSPILDGLDRRDLGGNANDEDTEMPDVKHITPISERPISERTTSTRLKSGIQSTRNGFKSIKFNDGQGGQAGEPVEGEDTMAYKMADVPAGVDNNCHSFKNSVDYAWAEFMHTSKMPKESMSMFFNNPDLAPMREHLSYKNLDEMRALLTAPPTAYKPSYSRRMTVSQSSYDTYKPLRGGQQRMKKGSHRVS